MIETAIAQLEATLATLRTVQEELAAETTEAEPTNVVSLPAADTAAPAADAATVAAPAEHDNSLPFKCPACGATYATQQVCQNGHPPEATLPTAEVIGGAAPTEPPADGTVAAPVEQAVVETDTAVAAPAAGPAAPATDTPTGAAPAAPVPTWPDGGGAAA